MRNIKVKPVFKNWFAGFFCLELLDVLLIIAKGFKELHDCKPPQYMEKLIPDTLVLGISLKMFSGYGVISSFKYLVVNLNVLKSK